MKKIIFGIAVLSLMACKSEKEVAQKTVASELPETPEVVLPETEPVANQIPDFQPVYRASETILTDLIHTKLEIEPHWETSTMSGIATITAKPHFYETDSLILDGKGMIINSVKRDGQPLKFIYKDDFIRINLGKTYTRKDKYTVVIDYVAQPEKRKTGGSAAITSDKGLYFINPRGEDEGVMPQIWTQGETESSSVWFPTIDSPNAKTTQEIFIKVDAKYETLSNGKLISSQNLKDGKRIDHWKQELPHAPYLFMLGIGEFKVVKDSYTKPDGSKMDVHYYVEPEWEPYARDIFGETPEMIRYFSKLLGVKYPWDKYHQIVVRDYVSGAMENTGAVIFGDFVYKNDRELLDGNSQAIIAHELFHHWFGDLVTCESWSNLPLNEAFANYSQYLWDEHRYGLDEAAYYAEKEAEGYYQSASFQGYHDLIWFDYDEKEQMFDGHSYNKGGRILHMLRCYLGDDAFFEGMKNYLVTNQFKPAEFHQLRLAFEEVSGEDLNWFFNQWFLASGHPNLDFKYELQPGKVVVTAEQKQDFSKFPLFVLPFEIAVFDDKGKHVHKVKLDQRIQTFEFPVNGTLKNIIYDDQQMLLARITEKKPSEFYVHQYRNGEKYKARLAGLMKGTKNKELRQLMILEALNDPFWHIRAEACNRVSKLKDANRDVGIAKLRQMASSDPKSSVRKSALKKLEQILSDNEVEPILTNAIKNDSSYSVVTGALMNLAKFNPNKAVELAGNLEKERSSSMALGIAQIYSRYGGEDKYDFIQKTLTGNLVQGFDKLGVLSSFTYFLTQNDFKFADKAVSTYEVMKEKGGPYAKMFMPQNINAIMESLDAKKMKATEDLKKHEEDKNPAYADQERKKIEQIESVKVKYQNILESIK